jgi:hypothetical protein
VLPTFPLKNESVSHQPKLPHGDIPNQQPETLRGLGHQIKLIIKHRTAPVDIQTGDVVLRRQDPEEANVNHPDLLGSWAGPEAMLNGLRLSCSTDRAIKHNSPGDSTSPDVDGNSSMGATP